MLFSISLGITTCIYRFVVCTNYSSEVGLESVNNLLIDFLTRTIVVETEVVEDNPTTFRSSAQTDGDRSTVFGQHEVHLVLIHLAVFAEVEVEVSTSHTVRLIHFVGVAVGSP